MEVQALGLRPSKYCVLYSTTTQDAAAAQDPDPRSRAFMLPDPELPLSDKDLPRLLELRRKSYFKIKRTYVRRDVQYARAVGNRQRKSWYRICAKELGSRPWRVTKINYIQKEVNACTQKVLFLELLC